jgi:hypothetical protein
LCADCVAKDVEIERLSAKVEELMVELIRHVEAACDVEIWKKS